MRYALATVASVNILATAQYLRAAARLVREDGGADTEGAIPE